ncbi:MAG: RNA polymerase sigma factor [Sandaracinaceae bacterium]
MAFPMIRLEQLRAGATGRASAWEEVYASHFAQIHRLIWHAGIPDAEAEDLAQRVFVIAYERIDDIRELTSLGGWLRGIALKVVASHRRWRRVRRVKDWLLQRDAPRPRASMPPDEATEERQRIVQVRAVLDDMSDKLREVLVLTDLHGLDPSEAAEALGVPVNTVRSRRRLAREQFGERWRARYPEDAR